MTNIIMKLLAEIARLRAELAKYKQYVLELDRELQTGEEPERG